MFDIVIRGGVVYDGLGGEPVPGDVGVVGDSIAVIGDLAGAEARQIVPATGKAVSPGFIDTHSHADLSLLVAPEAEAKIRQGVTTELVGQCGLGTAPTVPATAEAWKRVLVSVLGERPSDWSWPTFGAYLDDLERVRPALNVAALATHGAIRAAVVGLDDRAPTEDEMEAMGRLAEQALDDGAVGFSTGLVYVPSLFAERQELVDLFRRVAGRRKVVAIHIRNQGNQVLPALDEALSIAREANVSLQVSHLCAIGRPNWGKPPRMLAAIDEARSAGQDVTYDQHPYNAASTTLTQVIPPWAKAGGTEAMVARLSDAGMRARLKDQFAERGGATDPRRPWQNYSALVGWENVVVTAVVGDENQRYVGHSIAEIGEQRGVEAADAAMDLLIAGRGQVTMVIMNAYDAADLAAVMRHGAGMIGSDSIHTGTPHPRGYGSFPRVLGHFAREEGAVTMAEGVRRMTSAAAARLGLSDRGVLREGMAADVVVFDPATVRDRATYTNPRQFPLGIDYVLVNGQVVVDEGQPTRTRSGRVLR